MTRAIFFTGLLLSAFSIAACSGDKSSSEGPLAVRAEQLGPVTEDLVKDLPKGLIGDTANARYSSQQLRGEDEGDGT